METTSKRARLEEPVKQGFDFISCPNDLKLQILSKVDPDAALKLLQGSRFTRNYVLENRSYPESIEFNLTGREPKVTIQYKGSRRPTRAFPIVSARFPRVHSCDVLELRKGRYSFDGSLIRMLQLFPSLKFLNSLETDLGFNELTAIFKDSPVQIINGMNWRVGDWEDQDEASFIAFTRDHLKLCKRIVCLNQKTDEIWNLLKMMSFEHITLSATGDWTAVEILRHVLEDGRVPSLAENAELQCEIRSDPRNRFGYCVWAFQKELMSIVNDLLEFGPLERLLDPPTTWNYTDNEHNWQFRRAVTEQLELCVSVSCGSGDFQMNILHRPIAKRIVPDDA